MSRFGRAVAVLVVGAMGIAGCGSDAPPGDGTTSSGAPTSMPAVDTTSTSSSTSSAVTRSVSYLPAEPVWWSGFEIMLERAELDTAAMSLTIDLKLGNTAAIDTNLGSTQSQIAVRSNDRVIRALSGSDMVPHGDTIRSQLAFNGLPPDFDLASAQLVFGDVDQHQVTFNLAAGGANSSAEGNRPRVVPARVTIKNDHTQARFESTEVRLIPAACSGTNPVDVQYVPVDKDQLVLELIGTLASPSMSVGGVVAEHATATPADGISSVSEPGMGAVLGGANQPTKDYHLCFPVPSTTSGVVELAFDTRLVGEDLVKATGRVEIP